MTKQEYIDAGLRLSTVISDEELLRAETDAENCYVKKVYDFDRPSATEKLAIMHIAVILLLQRRAVATRAGGKVKLSPQLSENGGPTQYDFDYADYLLRKVQTDEVDNGSVQGNISEIVDDIAGIYYRNVFIKL